MAVVTLAMAVSSCAMVRVRELDPAVKTGTRVHDTPVTEAPVNLGFEAVDANGLPVGWHIDSRGARTGTDVGDAPEGAHSAWLASSLTLGMGSVSQCIEGDHYRGRTVAVSAMLRSSGPTTPNGGFVFARAQDAEGRGYAVRRFRPVASEESDRLSGRRWWARYGVAIDVPEDAHAVCFGFQLIGRNQVHADDFEVEVRR